jgi:DNA-binding transcriptional MerR regulator
LKQIPESIVNVINRQAKYTMAITVNITGVAAHRIRKFEEFGLCKPIRTDGKQRLFSDYDVETIKNIIVMERDGINLQGIKVILEMQSRATIKIKEK